MGKIGRNEPCPCGSGKKYKHCHLNKEKPVTQPERIQKTSTQDFANLLENHSSVQTLGLLAALQLHPENHGRNVRFERLCRETLIQFNPNDSKPLATWEQLQKVITNYTAGSHEEDPLTNAFTETAIFEEGNYIVYSGIYVGFTEILNQLTECIFLTRNNLNDEFAKKARDAIGLLLFMSDSAARDAGHVAYMYQKGTTGNIEFPDYETTSRYTDAVLFTTEFLNTVCEHHRYDIAILDDFILQPGTEELQNDDPDENVVNFKPIIALKDAVLLYMPTGILNALVSYIYQKAKEYNSYDELLDLFHARQFHLSCVALGSTGWLATDIKLPLLKDSLSVREMVFQFDNQKFGYVCFVQPNKNTYAEVSADPTKKVTDPYQERTDDVVEYLNNLNSKQQFGVFCLYIIAEVGQDFFFMWSKPSAGNQSLALTYRELWTITHSPKVNNLTLWKFAKCYSRTGELTRIMSMGGTLDAYANNIQIADLNGLNAMLAVVKWKKLSGFYQDIKKEHNNLFFINTNKLLNEDNPA